MPAFPRVLFFVEPATFRDDPLFLAPWINFIDGMVRCSAERFEAHLATSRVLAALAKASYVSRSDLSSATILEPFGFDRVAYMRDLCLGDGTRNDALISSLTAVRARVMPDIVVTWTENTTLRCVFTGIPLLNIELGPMPRSGFALTAHLDPFGHQIGSAFERFAEPRWDSEPFEVLIAQWLAHFRRKADEDAHLSGLIGWLSKLSSDRRKVVLALQPPDWLTYEGIGPALDPISLLRRTAASAEPGDLIIPQWHATQHLPSVALLADLQSDHPNVAVPPDGLKVARTESMLPHIDKLITISSNVALAAAILGKELTLLGRCKVSALATQLDARPVPRTDLIPFLVGSYCRPLSEWISREGAFFDHLRMVADQPQRLLAQPPSTTSLVPFLQA